MKTGLLLLAVYSLVSCGRATPRASFPEAVPPVPQFLKASEMKVCKTDGDCPLYHVCRSGRCYAQ